MPTPFVSRGAYTALATPFLADGSLDRAAWKKLVGFQVDQGIDGIVPGGTTGESPTLSWEEHEQMLVDAGEVAAGRCSILAGAGSNSTSEAIEATAEAKAHGASAVLLVDCYYNGPSSLELRTEYYERVLDAVPDVAIVPYVIPGRTGCALSAEDLAILHGQAPSRVPAVKESTGDLDRMRKDRALAGATLAIFSGDDDFTVPMMTDPAIRACGVISVMSNLAPAAMAKLVLACETGDRATADSLAAQLAPLFALVTVVAPSTRILPDGRVVEVMDKFRNPVAIKTMMMGLGMLGPVARRPLGKMTSSAVGICRSGLRKVWSASPELLRPIEGAFGVSIDARLADDAIWSALTR